ncbi:uncharacterized protein LOC115877096 [Sitophilus oryzae]|uniref:Uncharacterized protein LOC115877096 n=1 Tax=Sitophilus oryzae TaxID=7048 RepID=A0A6J2XCR2_SITOR|nr:uncharacterized protein LOC115877096 [Sitophilus oryzae]
MLRSIFSLIHRMIDSDKKYNNTKSKTVIYCCSNLNKDIGRMDLEIDGKNHKSMLNLEHKEKMPIEKAESSFQIQTDQGDTVTCKYKLDVNIQIKEPKTEENESRRVSFIKSESPQEDTKSEIYTQTNVQDLIKHFSNKRAEHFPKDNDQIMSLLEQIQKMKTGLQRLQEIAKQFNCSEKFGEDVSFLVNHVKKSLLFENSDTTKNENIVPKP